MRAIAATAAVKWEMRGAVGSPAPQLGVFAAGPREFVAPSTPILPIPDPGADIPNPQPLKPVKGGGQRVEVWSHDATTGVDTLVLRSTDGRLTTKDPVALEAYKTAKRVAEYYAQTFGRDGWDNKGSATSVKVHAPDEDGSVPMNNARWYLDEGRVWLGDGDGQMFSPLGGAADVVAHEFGHGVVDTEVRLDYEGQEGALHESLADVLASGIDGNWLIAERVFTPNVPGDALRDMANPMYQDMSQLPPDGGEVHDLSGVSTLAAVRAAEQIGGDAMRKVWYTAITDHMRDHVGFAGARKATIDAATKMFGATSTQVSAIRDAWDGVGITDTTPKQLFGAETRSAVAALRGEIAGSRGIWANGRPPKGVSGTQFQYGR